MTKRLISKSPSPLLLLLALQGARALAADTPVAPPAEVVAGTAAVPSAPAGSPAAAAPFATSVANPVTAAPSASRSVLSIETRDLAARGGLLLQTDGRVFTGGATRPAPDQILFRRIQPGVDGTLLENFDFRLLSDVAGGKLNVLDAWVDVRYVPYAKLRVGKFKSPFGLEFLQPSGALVLAERSLPTSLAPGYDTGALLLGDVAGVVSYAFGVVNGTVDGADAEGDLADGKDLVGRVFVQPFARTGWAPLRGLGIGGAVSDGVAKGSFDASKGTVDATELPSFKTEGRNTFFKYASDVITAAGSKDYGKLDLAKTAIADGGHFRWTAQGNYYFGPVGLQAEYAESSQTVRKAAQAVRATNSAFQGAASYVVFGGKASYKGVTPTAALDPAAGKWGAVEIAARYAVLHVDGDLFQNDTYAKAYQSARRAELVSGGVSWYLNRNLRVGADYAQTTFQGGAESAPGSKVAVNRAPERLVVTRVQTVF